jgi:hypothetical protein
MAVASASSGPVVHSKIFLAQYILTKTRRKTQDIWGGKRKAKAKKHHNTYLQISLHHNFCILLNLGCTIAKSEVSKFEQ